MIRRKMLAALAFVGAAALPALALAAPAVATADVNMRTGPGTAYQQIAVLPAGARAELHGCVEGRTWCDASWNGYRGWVAAAYLQVVYSGAPVAVVRAPVAVAPVLVYRPDVYYQAHYVGRPWYPYRAAPRRVISGPNHTCYRGPFVAGCR